tara:strand:- start:4817 stop:5104 length:288 start_codon:yes stop_codon:yes gene_type:complete
MKRSQMVEYIAEALLELYGGDEAEREEAREASKMHRLKTAHIALKAAEKNYMEPPGHMKPIPFESNGKQYPLVPGDFKNDAGIWCTPGQREWESE